MEDLDKALDVLQKQENLPTNRIMLIDGMNMFIRSFAALNLSNDNGNHVGGIYGAIQSIKNIIELFHPTKVIFCWEGKGASKKRRETLAEYKTGRDVRRSLNRTFQWAYPEQEMESFRAQLIRLKEYLETMPIFQVEIDQMEADDIIAYICNNVWEDQHKIIVSSDKDYFQLITDKVSVYRPVKKEIIDMNTMINDIKIYPKNWIIFKTLAGDSSDNVPGIKGLGMKTITKLFPFLLEPRQIVMDDIFEHCQKNINGSKHYKTIIDEKERLGKNWEVMQLLEHRFSLDGLRNVTEALGKFPVLKPFQLRLLLMQDNAWKQIANFDHWSKILVPLNQYEKTTVVS